MMRRSGGKKTPRMNLNISPPVRGGGRGGRGGGGGVAANVSPGSSSSSSYSYNTLSSASSSSPGSSCLSSEREGSRSPAEVTSMVLAGCPACLMYVMVAENEMKCPRCNSPVLLEFNSNKKNNNTTRRN